MSASKDLNSMAMDVEPCTMIIKKGNMQIELSACIVNITNDIDYHELMDFSGSITKVVGPQRVEIHAIGVPGRKAKVIQEAIVEEVEDYTYTPTGRKYDLEYNPF